jgi:uncharacterized protein
MRSELIGTRLTAFLSEDDRSGHRGLYAVLLERAQEHGLAGATLQRGIEGYGKSGELRTNRFPDLAAGLPLVLEFIDTPDQIEAFLSVLSELAPGALVTRESVTMIRIVPDDNRHPDDAA